MDIVSKLNKELDDEESTKKSKQKEKKKSSHNSGVRNVYEIMPKDFLLECENPNIEEHNMKIPMRMTCVSPSGSGKTNFIFNLIALFCKPPGTFYKIFIITRNSDEPLYNFLKSKSDEIQILEGMNNLPVLDKFDKDLPSLVVVDDLVLAKDQSRISNYFIRARKLNVSCIYISQSYYAVPKLIRQNSNYLTILRLSAEREIKMIMSESAMMDREKLMDLYNRATSTPMVPLVISMDTGIDDPKKFRKGFNEFLTLS
jgi:Ni2+-binding GTPase involved in maturation of urease and hydrogenase